MHPEKRESYERLEKPQPYRYSKRVVGTVVGINIGTTYSRVAAWSDKHNRVEIIPNKQGNKNTPSCVAWDGTELLTGEAAKRFLSMADPKNNVFDLKRLMGIGFNDDRVQKNVVWPFMMPEEIAENSMLKFELESWSIGLSCVDIYSMILRDLKEAAEAYLGKIVTHVVITVPVYFSDEQRQLTKDASTQVGLNVMRLIDEPTSAAIAYGLDKSLDLYCPKEKNDVVFNMGGRTFGVSLVNLNKAGTISVKASSGNPHLGGEVFDKLMVNHCVQEFKKKEWRDVTKSAKAMMRLKVACEKAKRDLTLTTQTFIEIRYRGLDFSIRFSREEFEELNARYFKECIEHVKICLRNGKLHKKDVDDVVIVGGSTLIPKVQQMLMEFFDGKPICKSINPDECVAYGAAVLAANLGVKGNELVQDVTPISLGYGNDEDDDMCVVLPRNTPIPTIKEVFFLTEYDKPVSRVAINVYEAESCKTTENGLLGSFLLDIIPAVTQTVKLRFDIDESGILNVSGEVLSTGCKKSITIGGSTKNSWKQLIKKIFCQKQVKAL